jgi:centrosomal protein CEP104
MSSQIPLNEVKFNRLGYLSLESNEKSGFQARELKSVYVDAFSLLLKIVLHKCHVNKFNLYNQVGVIAVNCMGEISKAKQTGGETEANSATFEEMMQLDEVTLERVKALKNAKDKAIKMEDYDEAKRLKEAIERLRSMGTHLSQLEERKKIAIDNEDFDAAKIIKVEIDRLRKTALDPAFNQGPYSDQPEPTEQNRPFSGGPEAPYAERAQYDKGDDDHGFSKGPPGGGMGMGLADEMDEMDIKPKLPMANKKKDLFGPGPGKGPGKGPQFPSDDNMYEEEKKMAMPMKPQTPQDIDEQVIPAARGNKGGGYEDDGGIIDTGGSTPSDVEEITGNNTKIAQPLIPALGEETIKKLFSKNWSNRETAISETEQAVFSNGDDDTIVAALGVAAQGIKDKISQVVLKTFDLLNSIMSVWQSPAPHDAGFHIDEIAGGIAARVGDNNSRIREKALEVGIELSAHPMAGHNIIIDHLSRTGGKKNVANSVRQQVGKYKLLHHVLMNTPISKPQEQRTVLNFALAGYKNSNNDIRNQAYECIIELYKVMGDSINKFLGDLRPAQVENLKNGFNQVDGIEPGMDDQDTGPKVTIETNITPFGTKSKKKTHQEGPQDGELDMLGESPSKFESSFKAGNESCQFCGKFEQGWDSEAIDMHYWKD